MRYSDEELTAIFDRASGYCHLCRKKLAFKNYGVLGARGAWEVDHSRPRVRGGCDLGINLYPACCVCNRSKGSVSTRTVRGWNGYSKAPLSNTRRKLEKRNNAIVGGVLGGLLGLVAGPFGAVAGAAIGATLGHEANPDS
ncbi:MAG: HNH endonuclease [Nitrospirota bacterium]